MDRRLEALEQLGRLRDQNVLSAAEFEVEKNRLLGGSEGDKTANPDVPKRKIAEIFSQKKVLVPIALVVIVALGIYFGISSTSEIYGKKVKTVENGRISKETENASEPVRLSSILRFERPSECAPGDELKTLLDDMRSLEPSGDSKSVNLGVKGPSVTPQVQRSEKNNAVIAQLVAPGVLEGLRVAELRTTRFEGSDIEGLQIRFTEDPEKVRRKLNGAGFAIPAAGELRTVELEDGHGLVYGVERVPDGSSLLCARL